MPPKTEKPKVATGRIIINCNELRDLSGIEITPAGNGQYAVTIRQLLTDQQPKMFREDYRGSLTIVYLHPSVADIRLTATFLDFGIQDENGQLIFSLYFRAHSAE